MKYFRQKRIELTDIDARWAGCYLLVGTKSFLDVKEMQKKIAKLQNEMELNDLKLRKLRRKIAETEDEELLIELQKLQDRDMELSDNLIGLFVQIVKENFISGIIFDSETNASRNAIADDVQSFDNDLLTRVVQVVLGNIEKKV